MLGIYGIIGCVESVYIIGQLGFDVVTSAALANIVALIECRIIGREGKHFGLVNPIVLKETVYPFNCITFPLVIPCYLHQSKVGKVMSVHIY
jgi:hypothetical protein